MKGLKLLYNKQMVKGLPLIASTDKVCQGCILGKQHRNSFPVGKSQRASKPLELVHADICGPMQTLSLKKNKYFIIFVNDFSRRMMQEHSTQGKSLYFSRHRGIKCFREVGFLSLKLM